ncbi:GNAT family N-acetyltransferase [Adonisia turfae]|uniref:N-acetyltransferase n=1 Tax=Adonisia turfae CCMR0081 TaxID=2292702 RepID=A0A6M0RRW5_9CYAN|nr:GNAT family N-acetyltransferase [Adonisia turfae]NEZ58984.1 N-acetyltransferase [Adonisia turfae CCMR0081]
MIKQSENTLTTAQQETAADVLGAAFAQDIFMAYLFPDAATRERNLAQLFLPIIRSAMLYGSVQFAPEHGVLAWLPGHVLPLNLFQLLRSGLIWTPLNMGFDAFNRLQAHDGFCEHVLLSKAPKAFAYLWLVGVHPQAKGQGLGKRMLQSALRDMYSSGYSTCLLRTDNEKNVPLYQHLGFEVIHTDIAPKSGLQYWLLSQITSPAD